MNLESELKVGDTVYSPKIGIGHIKSLEVVSRDGQNNHFYFVESESFQTTLMIPVEKATSKICLLEDAKQIHSALIKAQGYEQGLEFESKKDRVKYFQEQQKTLSFVERLMALKELNSFQDKGKVELQIFQNLQKGLIEEMEYICEIDSESAQQKIEEAIEI